MSLGLETVESAFRFVGEDHPHAPALRQFRELTASTLAGRGGTPVVRKLLRLAPDDPSRLRWVYLSLQHPGTDGCFEADTYLYTVRKDRLERWVFPVDPYLAGLPRLTEAGHVGAGVLQFVPRQRLAYLTREGLVGKLMRPADLALAYDRLRAVRAAVGRSEASFAVAAPRGIDRDAGVFFQELVPGWDLATTANGPRLDELLREAGSVVAEIHALDVPSAPTWSPGTAVSELRDQLRLVSLYRPGEGRRLAWAVAALLRSTPDAPHVPRFCHGDLRCGHLLVQDEAWAAIDFDGCRLGDPCQDVARLLAFLKRDIPCLRDGFADPTQTTAQLDEAIDAFLEGYAARSGTALDERRLLWYRAAHELHYLARMLKRDLFEPVSFARGVERTIDLARRAVREPATTVAVGGAR